MIEKDENLVMDEEDITENSEAITEEEIVEEQEQEAPAEKTYTQTEVNEMMGKRLARNSAKIHKEYSRKYGNLERVLKAGLGKESVEEMTDALSDFYSRRGVDIPDLPNYTDDDLKILARADANEIIESGFEEVVEEVDRLSEIGLENMTARERAMFEVLANHRDKTEKANELSEIGVKEDVIDSKDFKDFAKQFNSDVPITKVYKLYAQTHKNTNIEKIGSMKNGSQVEEKTFYTPEEVDRLTPEELDNPVIFKNVHNSMRQWK